MKNELFKLCGFGSNKRLSLLYRGSLHGFRAFNFHAKCDFISKTLTIIKSTGGNIFGGYTDAFWDQDDHSKLDENAFVFSLINKEKKPARFNVAKGKERNAIVCSGSYGPIFGTGSGNDLCIVSESNTNFNFSNFGHNYVHPCYLADSNRAKCFLAGTYQFKVEEIEVFQLK
jgi:hypothetical protein